MKKIKRIILFLILIGLLVAGFFLIKKTFFKEGETKTKNSPKNVEKLKIFDEDSNSRVIAVMINNRHAAWPHAGLQDSFLNYEIIVEGGVSRIMALFKDKDTDKIGSVRSSRPYFLDYVLENDAIYAHWGGSDEAYNDMKNLGIDHIDGLSYEGKYFYRDYDANIYTEHTGFTKMSMLKDGIKNLGIRNTTKSDPVFNYSIKEIDLSTNEEAQKADNIEIVYSTYTTTTYEYDEANKVYKRSMSGEAHVDAITGEQYTAKNIITYKVTNRSVDSYDRQELDNIGSGEGYYITNGYAVPITWEKTSRNSKTVYKYKSNGEEIKLNDGNTWVQIQPNNEYLGITSNIVENQE